VDGRPQSTGLPPAVMGLAGNRAGSYIVTTLD
jgi:hypothetical protein